MVKNCKKLFAFILTILMVMQMINTIVVASETEMETFVDSNLTDDSSLNSLSGFTLVNWASARCGYTTTRNIFTNTAANAYMVFDAGEGNGFGTADFRVTVHNNSNWIITQEASLSQMLFVSDDALTWTAAGLGAYADETINYDGATAYYTYTLSWDLGVEYRYLKIGSTLPGNNQLFIHNSTLKGVKSGKKLLFEDELTNTAKVSSIAGFAVSLGAYTNCGFSEARNVCYRSSSSSAYAIYNIASIGEVTSVEFDVTVSQSYTTLITGNGALDDMLYISTDGTVFSNAANEAGYRASYNLEHTQDGHYTYKITYLMPSDVQLIKFDATKFTNWQMYLTGVRFYGFAPVRNIGELLLNDYVLDRSNMAVQSGWGISGSGSTTGLWESVGCSAAQDVYKNEDDSAYAIYNLKGKALTKAIINIAVKGAYEGRAGTWKSILQHNSAYIYASAAGGIYTKISEVNVNVLQKNGSAEEYILYTIEAYLPNGTTHLKFAPEATENDIYFLTGVRLFGTNNDTSITNPLVLGDDVKDFNKMVENQGFSLNSWLGAKTGLAQPKNTAYKSGDTTAYITYQAPNNGTVTYAEFSVTVNSWNDSWKITSGAALDNNIYSSVDGVNFSAVLDTECIITGINYDGSTEYSNHIIRCNFDEQTKYIKIDAAEFTSWGFMLTEAMLYGPRTGYDYTSIPSLSNVFEGYFNTAVAIEPDEIYDYNELLLSQFNELTIENQMKPNVIHPSESYFSFYGTDRIVEFAMKHGLKVRGHGLVYEKSMPEWFFIDANGNTASKELVLQRLENHVRTIVRRYKGRIYCYDVVNEMFGATGWDTRELSAICGADEYIRKVFQWAHEEDPEAILILNDNFYDIPSKRQNIYNYVSQLVNDGVPIHGIGFQDHHFLDTSIESVDETLTLFSNIPNFKLFVTELDVRAYPFDDTTSVWPDYMEDEIKELLAKKYASLFDVYCNHSGRIETLGVWNICDEVSWTDESYVLGRKHFPTLFGYDAEPNPAFWSAVDFYGVQPRWTGGTMIPTLRNNNYSIDADNDMLTVIGTGSGNVTATLYSNFGTTNLLCTRTKNISNDFCFTFYIDTDGIYDGSVSPDYILEVTDSSGTKTDTFTYFSKDQRQKYYTVTDSMNDYSKVYRSKNCMFINSPSTYGGDDSVLAPLVFWSTANFGSGEVVYSVPDSFNLESFTIDMCTTTSGSFYNIYYSVDDISYTLANANWTLNSTDSGKYYVTGAIYNFPQNVKFIKVDLGTDTNKCIQNIKLVASPDPAVIYPETLMLIDNLTNSDNIDSSSGFTLVNWAWGRCGYSMARNIFCNSGANAYMVFDAGADKNFTSAKFRVTAHVSSAWHITQQEHLNKMLYISDDGVTWTAVVGGTYNQEGDPKIADNINYYTYIVSWEITPGARYIKVGSTLSANYQLFVHRAKLYGGDTIN